MAVESEAEADGCAPHITVHADTLMTCGDVALDATFTVTVIGG
jgi:hypothetical protein